MEKDFLLGCDWGTTTLRLTLCDAETLAVRAEVRSDEGVASTFRDWKESDPGGAVSRERYFRRRLGGHLARLSQSAGMSVEGIPLVVSGMASSSLGMQELPYANLPFSLDGGDAVSRYRVGDGWFRTAVFLELNRLISILRNDHYCMPLPKIPSNACKLSA